MYEITTTDNYRLVRLFSKGAFDGRTVTVSLVESSEEEEEVIRAAADAGLADFLLTIDAGNAENPLLLRDISEGEAKQIVAFLKAHIPKAHGVVFSSPTCGSNAENIAVAWAFCEGYPNALGVTKFFSGRSVPFRRILDAYGMPAADDLVTFFTRDGDFTAGGSRWFFPAPRSGFKALAQGECQHIDLPYEGKRKLLPGSFCILQALPERFDLALARVDRFEVMAGEEGAIARLYLSLAATWIDGKFVEFPVRERVPNAEELRMRRARAWARLRMIGAERIDSLRARIAAGDFDDGETLLVVASADRAAIESVATAADERGISGSVHSVCLEVQGNSDAAVLLRDGAEALIAFLDEKTATQKNLGVLAACDSGFAVSGAIACALERVRGADDVGMWADPSNFAPDADVYRSVLEAAGISVSDDQLAMRVELARIAREKHEIRRHVRMMHLNDGPFGKIASGEKMVELRVMDEKRRRIDIGDAAVFVKSGSADDIVMARDIVRLDAYRTFEEMLSNDELRFAAGFGDVDASAAARTMEGIYPDKGRKPAVAIWLDGIVSTETVKQDDGSQGGQVRL